MTEKKLNQGLDRRTFLKGVAAAAPASGLSGRAFAEQKSDKTARSVSAPSSHTEQMEKGIPDGYSESQAARYFVQQPGSDIMVDVLKQLGIDYVASNPGSSFRGLQESITTYGGNNKPEFLTCLHEESAVAMGHGYAKTAGKPMAMACHGTVGLQHAAMAIYNAWCDKVPAVIIAGNHLDVTDRRIQVSWAHSVQDAASLVRDFTKWDDTPVSLQHFVESLVRAYKIATTPPMGPVVLVADAHQQEAEVGEHSPAIPLLSPTIPPRGGQDAVREAARLLIEAQSPVILADRAARTAAGPGYLVTLAELLQAPVIDKFGRMNFPNDHYLYQFSRSRELIASADVILGLEMTDMWGSVNRMLDLARKQEVRLTRPEARLISIGLGDLYLKSNYQNMPVDLSISGDAEATLPSLIEEVKTQMSRRRQSQIREREQGLRQHYQAIRERDREEAKYAWNASPVSTARLCMEIWELIKDRDWALHSSEPSFQSYWPHRLWAINQHHQFTGGSGGYGVGYGAPAAVGAGLANREHGRLTVNIQADGDMLYAPGILWTAAHHGIPLLSVMHNNRAYHQEIMHLQRMGLRRQRGIDGNAAIGTVIDDPAIDFAQMAGSMGVWATGPITNPSDLGPALRRALDVIDQGEPALVDVVCQPR